MALNESVLPVQS